MDSFTTTGRNSDFILAPRAFDRPRRKRYISYSSKEEGAAEGSPLAQLLMDTPEPDSENQPLVRKTTPMEEGDHGSGESPVDKMNGKHVPPQLNDAFLEDPEALDSVASDSEEELGPSCFYSMLVQSIDEDTEDDSYVDLRRRLGMELTEAVPRREHKKVMHSIAQIHVGENRITMCQHLFTL
ncbi:uncharacterized protein LOC122174172 isoform X2 [Chrysemys picta bellii]|uniref:uncharacterized protein LOC122174172 isoform X2 n=1 Tax=Chrysemys picta bellii TaxID=8478 RepID=UPI0032B164E8